MRIIWRIIAIFFKWSWRLLNFIREFCLNLIFIFFVFAGAGIWLQLNNAVPKSVTRGALRVDLSGVVVDKPDINNKLSKLGRQLLGSGRERFKENSLFDIVAVIRQAQTDKNITGMVLDLQDFIGGDQASLQYIGKVLREFRDSGKPIYANADSYSQAQYYLASFANRVYLSPQGMVDLHGFATHGLYYKSLLDKLKINSHVFRVGTYKSAVEPFLRDDMSPEARDADSRWINELWQSYLNTVAANRQMTPQQLFPGADAIITGMQQAGNDPAHYAVKNKLVDELASRTLFDNAMINAFGFNTQSKEYNNTSIYDYPLQDDDSNTRGNIAVVVVSGAIMEGEDIPGSAGSDTIAQQIREARLNPAIKAIILRVNSPGGSVTASETIREALAAAKSAEKPVVVSMGGMAASGGYWISTPADYLIASPVTLTGSIGIFGVINTLENTLDSIGVHTDGVTTSPLANVSLTRALPEQAKHMMQLNIENGYKHFIKLVAQSRHKTPTEIDQIAQGHVWTGSDAQQNGLVDALGDFDDAVAKAAELAHLNQVQLFWYQTSPAMMDMLLSQVNLSLHATLPAAISAWLPAPALHALTTLKSQSDLFDNLHDPQNRYAICLTCGNID
ncbi:signal peptide peptidase SppA [Enterobacteriaceae bacterium LUAb1]